MTSNTSIEHFGKYVAGLRSGMKRQYDRGVNRDLSQQKWQGVFKRNVTGVLKQAYDDALAELQQLPLANDGPAATEDYGGLRARVLLPFEGVIDELIHYALQKHRSSCALSHFPEEHRPSQDYIAEVIQETGKDWAVFALQVNNLISR